MKPLQYLQSHSVFTHAEFVAEHTAGGRSRRTSDNLLAGYLRSGRLRRLRRGLYATAPPGAESDGFVVDPYLVATKLTEDATVAYHAALQFHGKTYTLWPRLHFLTATRTRPLRCDGLDFVPVLAPVAVRSLSDFGGQVVTRRHAGGEVRVTTLERALVDTLDAPEKCGGWEEVWRSLEMVEFFDLDAVTDYARTLGSALTVARVGFFLEQHRDELMVEDAHLDALLPHAPAQPRYLDSRREPGRLVARWNLIVPERVLSRAWEEVS